MSNLRTALALLAIISVVPQAFAQVPALPQIVSVTDLPNVKQNPVILLRDGNYSELINGISYWSFADTGMSKSNASGQSFIDNSLSASTRLNATDGIALNKDQDDSSGLPTRWIPFTTNELNFDTGHSGTHCTAGTLCGASLALWPQAIAYDAISKDVVVPFVEIVRGGGISGYPAVGSGLAVGRVRADGTLDMTRPVQNPGSTTPTLMWSKNEQPFTDQSFFLNGYYYAYGNRNVFVTTQDILARVPSSQLLNKSAWTYYAGNGLWSSNELDAAVLFDGSASGSSVFYNPYLGVWMAIFSGNFSDSVYYAVAKAPEGPWSTPALLFTGQTGYQNNADYCTRAHPEFSPDNGQTEYISYVHASAAFGQNLPLVKVVFAKAP